MSSLQRDFNCYTDVDDFLVVRKRAVKMGTIEKRNRKTKRENEKIGARMGEE